VSARVRLLFAAAFGFAALAAVHAAETPRADVFAGTPRAVVDLATTEGTRLVKGEWRYSDTRIVEARFIGPGADGQPTGDPVDTYDYTPKAGGAEFDDSGWEVIAPESLSRPRGRGHVAFNWYRMRLTVPSHIGDYDPSGSTVIFESKVDDYAEIWVDGEIAYAMGDSGGPVVKGWNANNRLVIGRDVKPGQQIQLAVFGINGPISRSPTNFIFLHHARLEFHDGPKGPMASPAHEVNIDVDRLDPEIDRIVSRNPKLFKLADGFQFTEGPVWVRDGGYLLFSDPNANTIYKYTRKGVLSVFRSRSGYDGADIAEYSQPGSNGLTLDGQGRLTFDEHGNHRVSRMERDGTITVLADSYQGKRLNSPNDLVIKSDGAVYFTDPPFGLPGFFDDPRKELPFSGIYRIKDGAVTLLSTDLTGPNGIAFSPDEKYLYVGNWDAKRKVVMRYPVNGDGTLATGKVFFDMTGTPGDDAIDGIKVDVAGHLYVSGPGGLWVLAEDGRHLGTIHGPKHAHNMAWGDDGATLYLTAQTALYRLPLKISGIRP
jgi:gluconolactonase